MFVDEADLDLYFRKALLFHIKHLQIQVGENINLQTYFQNVTNACVFHGNWTPKPPQTGHAFHANLDTSGVTTRGRV